jgi:phosphate:Na+ symporter
MIDFAFKLVGGIGLFLLGMLMLTQGIKAFAGEALKGALLRFTGTPFKALSSGALVTLLVQSSSATTVTIIGFVSAGLLAFPQAVGVVLGASLGTTGTGWIVSIIGLKISLGFYALPLVGVGTFMKLLGKGRSQSMGGAVAGFALIFIGIETLQEGMQGFSSVFDLGGLPSGGFWGQFLAVFIGIVMTVIMQSSSAAIATILTALHTQTVNFDQASTLLIGAAIGTTVTGALAALGGSVPAKRTALAHVIFNLATGLIAILLLPLFLWLISLAQEHFSLDAGATSLAAFHTLFITVGVLVFFPFLNQFCRFIQRLLPEKGSATTQHLDDTLLSVPEVALETTRRALCAVASEVFSKLQDKLKFKTTARTSENAENLEKITDFFSRIPVSDREQPFSETQVSQMHALDHLMRFNAAHDVPDKLQNLLSNTYVKKSLDLTLDALAGAQKALAAQDLSEAQHQLVHVKTVSLNLAEERRVNRPLILQQGSQNHLNPTHTLEILDAIRWMDRIVYHVWRITNYLVQR